MSAAPGAPEQQFGRIRQALNPPGDPPAGPPWNLDELEGLLSDAARLVPAAVMMGLVPRDGGLNVLMTLRNRDLRQHAGQVSLPGGRIDAADAGPLAAALREVREETGIVAAQVQPLGWLDPLATVTGFRVLPLVARLAPDIAPAADPREVDEVFEVPLAHLLHPGNLRRVPIEYRGRTRYVLEYLPHQGGARIWGATASILCNLMERLAAVGMR